MKSNEFDDLLRQRFEEARMPYNPANWQKLSSRLDEKESSKGRTLFLLPLASIAASVAMAMGVVTWVNQSTNTGPMQAQVTYPVQNRVPSSNNPTISIGEEQPDSDPTTTTSPAIAASTATEEQAQITPFPEAVAKEEPAIVALADNNSGPITPTTRESHTHVATVANNVFYDNISPVKQEKKTFVTIMGGINYGTLNSGYVMGFAAGTKLNDRFYLESDVAFVGNISSSTSVSFITQRSPSPSTKNGKATDVTYTTKTVEQQKFYNIYYAQVTPTLGYKVANKLSVGVGADVQRLLINDKLVSESDNKELPGFDLGAVGKAEYSLSKEIRASVYYRKGMNQTLSGNNKYLDRDYLQVQLKFTIFNR
ncbi:MAG: hypothetical protein JNL72_11100 [Flavipsychrobacter sp.]|nr:hypothetical protein [Flavipsychrobacter sp.]